MKWLPSILMMRNTKKIERPSCNKHILFGIILKIFVKCQWINILHYPPKDCSTYEPFLGFNRNILRTFVVRGQSRWSVNASILWRLYKNIHSDWYRCDHNSVDWSRCAYRTIKFARRSHYSLILRQQCPLNSQIIHLIHLVFDLQVN